MSPLTITPFPIQLPLPVEPPLLGLGFRALKIRPIINSYLFIECHARRLARIHRRRASGQCPESARGCSCESGIMVLKQQNRPQNKEHPIDATTQPSRSHPNRV